MPAIEEWKNTFERLKKFTKEECKLMKKSDLIKYLLMWQECAHQALEMTVKQDEIFNLIGLFEDLETSIKQYIIFTNSNNFNKFQSIKNDKLLNKFSNEYFGHSNSYTINDFDKLCQDTRKELKNNILLENTELYKILNELKNEKIYIWSGSEFNLLADCKSFEGLINYIHELINENKVINLVYNNI
jgi:hypothetical protein